MNLEESLAFVKSQAEFHDRMAERYGDDLRRSEQHQGTAQKFRQVCYAVEKFSENRALDELSGAEKLHLSWEELEGLPDELLAELSISDSDQIDFSILGLIKEAGGIASLDRIILSLYRQTGDIVKRQNLNARLYRMVQKEQIYSVPGKKGVYATIKIVDSEIEEKKSEIT